MTQGVSKTKLTSGHDSRPFALQQNNIDKHITNRLHYYKILKDKLDAQATKASSIALRKQWLDKQKKINYQSEYDRIRGQIEHNNVKGLSVESLKKRRDDLARLGAKVIDGIADQIIFFTLNTKSLIIFLFLD